MKFAIRTLIFLCYLLGTILFIIFSFLIIFESNYIRLLNDWTFILLIIFYLLSIEELYRWVKDGRRSEMSDIIAIFLFFFLIFFLTKDLLTSIIGAFSIYLWFGIYELKDYPVLNKILIISLTTYNVIFVSGLISSYLNNPIVLNTAFAFSFWIILILGFILFGRKYLVVWRFLSPEYLTLFLYIIAWLIVVFIDEYTPINFVFQKPFYTYEFNFLTFFLNIYFILIVVNWIVYFISGPILDSMLGIKRIKDKELLKTVEEVKNKIGIKGRVKSGFGKYPIINAMAYGSFLDKRIAIIAEDLQKIPKDEIKGMIAHELSHTKGRHTLILTLITSLDLIFRMFMGIPATFYDYTFGNPQIPLLYFILLNFGIYILLFIFVRILEGKADLKTKESGYAEELIKALYNLESFYATGREIGLNTMLLCDEKITDYNNIINYIETADYLNNSMIKPSKWSLLSNLMNSHPPTYYRIASVLDNNITPYREALLPFLCLKDSNRQNYAKKFESARIKFKKIANKKFKDSFEIQNISDFMAEIERKEPFKFDIGNQFIFKHKINKNYIFGTIKDIKFYDDVCDKEAYILENSNNAEDLELNTAFYEKFRISMGDQYYFEKEGIIKLIDVTFSSDKKNGTLFFMNDLHEIKDKEIKKTKLPNPISLIQSLENNDLFFKLKGMLKIFYCQKVNIVNNFKDSSLILTLKGLEGGNRSQNFKLRELIIKPKDIYLFIKKDRQYRRDEIAIINWLKSKQLRAYFHLKKPVNNLEIGYIHDFNLTSASNNSKTEKKNIGTNSLLVIKNIFNKYINIPINELESLSFQYKTVSIQKKADTSLFTKISYKLLKRLKPQKIIYL